MEREKKMEREKTPLRGKIANGGGSSTSDTKHAGHG